MLRALGLVAIGLTAAAAGCTALAGLDDFEVVGGDGGSGGCTSATQCPGTDTTCRYRTCIGNTCGMENAEQGTPCTEGVGEVCDNDGNCVFDVGHLCGGNDECANDLCVDNFCCDVACAGTCEACAASKTGDTDGTCAPIPILEDPDGDCTTPPALGCDGSGSCATCGTAATPPGGTCPAPPTCDLCENGDTCVIDCDLEGECDGATIDCPAGWHCEVRCREHNACRNAVINCPDKYRCTVTCGTGNHSCQQADLNCSQNGPCAMNCPGGEDNCVDAELYCQKNDCTATCNGGDLPTLVNCAGPCACTECS